MRQRDFVWLRLLLMLLLLLPLAVLFLMPGNGMVLGTMWFWLALMLCFWMVWMVLGVPRDERAGAVPVILGPRALAADELPPVVRQVMDVRLATEHNGVLAFRGPLCRTRWGCWRSSASMNWATTSPRSATASASRLRTSSPCRSPWARSAPSSR